MIRKRKNSKKRHQGSDTLRYIDNQLTLLFNDKDLLSLFDEQRKKLNDLPKQLPTTDFIVNFNNSVRTFLQSRNLPLSLLEPIYGLVRYNRLDVPLHTSIILRVGKQDVLTNRDVVYIKNKQGKLAFEENSVSIVLTTKTSTEQVIQFVKDNKKLIEDLQSDINLPAYQRPTWRGEIQLALKIIKMKEEEDMSFDEIASNLADPSLPQEQYEKISDENTIKSIYYRYKKRLSH